jgi:hypothetical protein
VTIAVGSVGHRAPASHTVRRPSGPPPPSLPALLSFVTLATPTATTVPINTTGATVIAASLSNFGSPGGLTDSLSNTWTFVNFANGNNNGRLAYCINPATGAAHTFTTTGASEGAVIAAFTGTPPTATAGINFTQTTLAATVPLSGTPPAAPALIVALAYGSAGTTNFAISGGLAVVGFVPAGSTQAAALAWVAQATAAAVSPTWTLTGGTGIGYLVSFQ